MPHSRKFYFYIIFCYGEGGGIFDRDLKNITVAEKRKERMMKRNVRRPVTPVRSITRYLKGVIREGEYEVLPHWITILRSGSVNRSRFFLFSSPDLFCISVLGRNSEELTLFFFWAELAHFITGALQNKFSTGSTISNKVLFNNVRWSACSEHLFLNQNCSLPSDLQQIFRLYWRIVDRVISYFSLLLLYLPHRITCPQSHHAAINHAVSSSHNVLDHQYMCINVYICV